MRAFRLAVAFMVVVGLAACGSGEDPSMAGVAGKKLDVAQSDIERSGFDDEVDIVGGGLFGVVDESNWDVCEQTPAPGEPLTEAPRLVVERDCNQDDAEPSEEAEEGPSAEPEEEPSEEPSEEPEETVAASPPSRADADDREQPRARRALRGDGLLRRLGRSIRGQVRRQEHRVRRVRRVGGEPRRLRDPLRLPHQPWRSGSRLDARTRFQVRGRQLLSPDPPLILTGVDLSAGSRS